jgi:hypothetical protein
MTTLRVRSEVEKFEMKPRSVVTSARSLWYFVGLYGVEKRRGAAPTTLSGG